MRRNWWKVLTGVILLFTLLAGMLVPLKPGIESVTPSSAVAGELLVLRVTGYNTFFKEPDGSSIRAWLKLNNKYALQANQVLVQSDRNIRVSFSLPKEFPIDGERHRMSLIIDDPVNGAIVSPDAIFVAGCVEGETAIWESQAVANVNELEDFRFPYRTILYESIRNTYYHVPMWFGMILLFFGSAWYSIKYIRQGNMESDMYATALNTTGAIFGVLGIITGMFWSTYTWGAAWSWDVKQNTAAITLLIYFAYFILRSSFEDPERKARISSVYNVFACAMIIPLLFVIPRMTDSLHPGSGGNPAMGGEDLDNTMRMIFYPAVIGWTMLGVWISQVLFRISRLRERIEY